MIKINSKTKQIIQYYQEGYTRIDIAKKFKYNQRQIYNLFRYHRIPLIKFDTNGKNNSNWKGSRLTYFGLHTWIKRHKTKSLSCENCAKITINLDASNISGKYKRDVNDFEWLCRKCHTKKHYPDGRWGKNYNGKEKNK